VVQSLMLPPLSLSLSWNYRRGAIERSYIYSERRSDYSWEEAAALSAALIDESARSTKKEEKRRSIGARIKIIIPDECKVVGLRPGTRPSPIITIN
jgi:hypothetical protein